MNSTRRRVMLGAVLVMAAAPGTFPGGSSVFAAGENLPPARDLKGVWVSALRGRGFQESGRFNVAGVVGQFDESGDITLRMNAVTGNDAVGTIQYSGLVVTGSIRIPPVGGQPGATVLFPRTPEANLPAMPVSLTVSSSRLVFPTYRANGVTVTMTGSFTTDIMTGAIDMNLALPGFRGFNFAGQMRGTFRLLRQG